MDIEKLKCKECGQEFTKIDCVTRHAKMVHNYPINECRSLWLVFSFDNK